MDPSQRRPARSAASSEIILTHVGAAMAAAATPIPLVDVATVTAIQIALVRRLAARYEVEFDAVRVRSAVLALAGATLARLGASAAKLIPGGGTLVGAAAQVTLSGASTYALGEAYRGHFEARGTLADFDPDAMRDRYREAAERGREIVRALRRQRRDAARRNAASERSERRERLERLQRSGILTRSEYDVLIAALEREAAEVED
jgi:uncharacterized protein (DUF697 family)